MTNYSLTDWTCPVVPVSSLQGLSEESRRCIERLRLYDASKPDLSLHRPSKLGAVLVLLFERAGELRVLLTTRSKYISQPGDTALPGGMLDKLDKHLVDTAFREAFEEVALPIGCPDAHVIGLLEPVFSTSRIVVTPVVAVLSNPAVLDHLRACPREVARIFDHPLRAILDPSLMRHEAAPVPKGSEDWPYETDWHRDSDHSIPSLGMDNYRLHRFRSTASPIKGLTADILINTAQIAYREETTYERYAPGQVRSFAAISKWLITQAKLKKAESDKSQGGDNVVVVVSSQNLK